MMVLPFSTPRQYLREQCLRELAQASPPFLCCCTRAPLLRPLLHRLESTDTARFESPSEVKPKATASELCAEPIEQHHRPGAVWQDRIGVEDAAT
jgi:hypothetical protein